jgi:hypothetical protein
MIEQQQSPHPKQDQAGLHSSPQRRRSSVGQSTALVKRGSRVRIPPSAWLALPARGSARSVPKCAWTNTGPLRELRLAEATFDSESGKPRHAFATARVPRHAASIPPNSGPIRPTPLSLRDQWRQTRPGSSAHRPQTSGRTRVTLDPVFGARGTTPRDVWEGYRDARTRTLTSGGSTRAPGPRPGAAGKRRFGGTCPRPGSPDRRGVAGFGGRGCALAARGVVAFAGVCDGPPRSPRKDIACSSTAPLGPCWH